MRKSERGKHKRPTAEQLDERVSIPLDTATTIEALMRVDPDKVDAKMPKRVRKDQPAKER